MQKVYARREATRSEQHSPYFVIRLIKAAGANPFLTVGQETQMAANLTTICCGTLKTG